MDTMRTREFFVRLHRTAAWIAATALVALGVPVVAAAPAWAGTADVAVVLDDTSSASPVPDGVLTVYVNGIPCTQDCVVPGALDDVVQASVHVDDLAWTFVGFGATPVCESEGNQTSTTCTWTAIEPTTLTVKVKPRALTSLTLARTPAGGGTASVTQYTDDGYSVDKACPDTGCSASVDRDSTFDLFAQEAEGYRFVGWTFTGGAVTPSCTTQSYCTVSTTAASLTATATFEQIPTTATLTVVRSPQAGGTVSSSPAGISCGAICSASFTLDAPLTLTATPASGYRVTDWSGVFCDEFEVGNTCTLSTGLFEDTAVTVTFEQVVTLTVGATFTGEAGGSATIDWENNSTFDSGTCSFPSGPACALTLSAGDSVTLTPQPAAGTAFTGWSGLSCAPGGFGGSCTVTVATTGTLTAAFAVVGQATLTVRKTGGAGTVEVLEGYDTLVDCTAVALASGPGCQATVTKGTEVRLVARGEGSTAGQRSVVGAWTTCTSPGDDQFGSTCVVSPSANREISVLFDTVPDGVLDVVLAPTVGSLPPGAVVEGYGDDEVACGRTEANTVVSDCRTTGRLHDGAALFISAPAGWRATATGCELDSSGRCQLYLTAASTVTVTFTNVGVWTVTIARTGAGAGDSVDYDTGGRYGTCTAASCPVSVTKGDYLYVEAQTSTAGRVVALTAPAGTGCTVTGTVVDRTCYGKPTANVTVTAAFSAGTTRSIGAKVATGQEAGGGVSMPGSPTCSNADSCAARPLTIGSTVTVYANPALGWNFASWTGCPAAASGPACTFTVAADSPTLITANFTNVGTVKVTLSVPSTLHGSGSLEGSPGCTPVSGSVLCDVTITKGRQAYVSAWFDEGWIPSFAGTCTYLSYDSCTVTATANTTITLTFVNTPLSTAAFTATPASGASLLYRGPGTSAFSEECGSSCSIVRRTGTSIESRAGDPTPGYVHLSWAGCALTRGHVCELPTAAATGGTSTATASFAVAADTALRGLTVTNSSTSLVALDGMSEFSYFGYDSSLDCSTGKTCSRDVFQGQRLTLRTYGAPVKWTVSGATVSAGCAASSTTCVVTVGASDVAVGAAAAGSPPVRTSGPTVSGTAKVGYTLTCVVAYTGATSVTYKWYVNGAATSITTRTLALTATYAGKRLACASAASNSAGSVAAKTSPSTAAVALGTIRNVTKPSISGTSSVGKTLTARVGSWSPTPSSYQYRWQVLKSGKYVNITGATARTYKVPKAMAGKYLRVQVTAVKAGYAKAVAYSARVRI